MNSYDFKDIEFKHPKCILTSIIIGIILEFTIIITINYKMISF